MVNNGTRRGEANAKAAGELATLGKEIAARVKVMKKYEAQAEEKAGFEMQKAQEARQAIEGKLIPEARDKCKAAGKSFREFQTEYFPDIGRTRLYKILAIADGRTTEDQERARGRDNKRNQRASATEHVQDTSDDDGDAEPSQGNDDFLENDTGVPDATLVKIGQATADMPFAEGLAKSKEMFAEARGEVAQDNTPKQGGATSPAAKKPMDASTADMVAKHSQASKENLEKFAAALDLLNRMTTTDRQAARDRTEERWVELGIKKRGQAA